MELVFILPAVEGVAACRAMHQCHTRTLSNLYSTYRTPSPGHMAFELQLIAKY